MGQYPIRSVMSICGWSSVSIPNHIQYTSLLPFRMWKRIRWLPPNAKVPRSPAWMGCGVYGLSPGQMSSSEMVFR